MTSRRGMLYLLAMTTAIAAANYRSLIEASLVNIGSPQPGETLISLVQFLEFLLLFLASFTVAYFYRDARRSLHILVVAVLAAAFVLFLLLMIPAYLGLFGSLAAVFESHIIAIVAFRILISAIIGFFAATLGGLAGELR